MNPDNLSKLIRQLKNGRADLWSDGSVLVRRNGTEHTIESLLAECRAARVHIEGADLAALVKQLRPEMFRVFENRPLCGSLAFGREE